MNKYGQTAQHYWKTLAPNQYQELENPQEFFTNLGEQAMANVLYLETQIAGDDPEGETYLEKVGRLYSAKRAAEEIVQNDLLMPPQIENQDDEEQENPNDFWTMESKKLEKFLAELKEELRKELQADYDRKVAQAQNNNSPQTP